MTYRYQQSVFKRYHSDKHFSQFLPTRRRQKSAGTNMEQNYVTVTPPIATYIASLRLCQFGPRNHHGIRWGQDLSLLLGGGQILKRWFAIGTTSRTAARKLVKNKIYKNWVGRRRIRSVCDEISGPRPSLERLKTFAPTKSVDSEHGSS